MVRLFHVSEDGPFDGLQPRPAPPGSSLEGEAVVWAVDEEHLPNYLLPRDCPRVCWLSAAHVDAGTGRRRRTIAVEQEWLPRLRHAALCVHELEPDSFEPFDATAGYWVSRAAAIVRSVTTVADCVTALARHGVALRVTRSLWPYVDAVTARGGEFSVIRMRNAAPRSTSP